MGYSPFGGVGDIMFSVMPVIFVFMFLLVLGVIIGSLVKGAKQWKRNNDSPVLTVDAIVVTKRTDVSHHRSGTDNMHSSSSSSTTYYVTFQVASGDRFELVVRDTEYGLLVEKDEGKLTFQGTRYLGFERNRSQQNNIL